MNEQTQIEILENVTIVKYQGETVNFDIDLVNYQAALHTMSLIKDKMQAIYTKNASTVPQAVVDACNLQ